MRHVVFNLFIVLKNFANKLISVFIRSKYCKLFKEHLEFSTQTENSRSLDIIWNTSIYVQNCELGIVVIQISAT